MDKPNVRLILRALRKNTNAKLAIHKNKHLLGEGAESIHRSISPTEDTLPGEQLDGEINNHQISLPGF
jgi:hypothetical protein